MRNLTYDYFLGHLDHKTKDYKLYILEDFLTFNPGFEMDNFEGNHRPSNANI